MAAANTPDRPLLTQPEVVNWIAFEQATEADLTGHGHWREWRTDSDAAAGMIRALRAVAGEMPLWTPRPLPANTPEFLAQAWRQPPPEFAGVEGCARALAEAIGRPAAVLADELQSELEEYERRCAAHYDAQIKLSAALAGSRISETVAPRLPPYTEFPAGTVWYMKADVLALWPVTTVGADAVRAKPTDKATRAGQPARPSKDRVNTWMRGRAEGHLRMHGHKLQRSQAIKDCTDVASGMKPPPSQKQAADAYAALPGNLKYKRGESHSIGDSARD